MLYLIPLLSDSREIPRTKCKTFQEAEAQGQLGNFGESFEANGLWPVYINCTISKKNSKRTKSVPLSFFFFSRHKFFKFRVNSELNKVISNWVEACSAPGVNSIKKSQVPLFFFCNCRLSERSLTCKRLKLNRIPLWVQVGTLVPEALTRRERVKGKTWSEEKGLWPRPLRISLSYRYLVQILNLVSDWLLKLTQAPPWHLI